MGSNRRAKWALAAARGTPAVTVAHRVRSGAPGCSNMPEIFINGTNACLTCWIAPSHTELPGCLCASGTTPTTCGAAHSRAHKRCAPSPACSRRLNQNVVAFSRYTCFYATDGTLPRQPELCIPQEVYGLPGLPAVTCLALQATQLSRILGTHAGCPIPALLVCRDRAGKSAAGGTTARWQQGPVGHFGGRCAAARAPQ